MEQGVRRNRRRRGRPPIDDRDQILGYFASGIAAGKSVSELAKVGLRILRYVEDQVGQNVLKIVRHQRGATLERRYRRLLESDQQLIARAQSALNSEGAQTIGISPPRASLSFSHGKTLRRGRPRKKSIR